MPVTFLLDLDDTLLKSNMEAFIPEYFSALSTALADVVKPEEMLPALMGGTKLMMVNEDPAHTLKDVFDGYFYPRLTCDQVILQDRINHFYDDIFPGLKRLTQPRPEAVEFVDWAVATGNRVTVATNPFFPLKAILHRLRWAGLSPEDYPFELISSYETFHFTKAFGSYFSEFVGQIGWPDGPIVMVGNDFNMDLVPAKKAGLPVFWINEKYDDQHNDIPQGSFSDLRNWIENTDPERLLINWNTLESVLTALVSTPAILDALTSHLPDFTWDLMDNDEGKTLRNLICLLGETEKNINLPGWKRLLSENKPFHREVPEEIDVSSNDCGNRRGRENLQEFIVSRKSIIGLLKNNVTSWDGKIWVNPTQMTTWKELLVKTAVNDKKQIQGIWSLLKSAGQKSNIVVH